MNCGNLLGDRQSIYQEYMDGCSEFYGVDRAELCDETEDDRIQMNRMQPKTQAHGQLHEHRIRKAQGTGKNHGNTARLLE
jgi:hypothetical protein